MNNDVSVGLPTTPVKGFSKLSKNQKIDFLVSNYFGDSESARSQFKKFWHADENIQKIALLRIYGREGSIVFEQLNFQPNDPLLGWNGRLKGKKVQTGVYTWLLQVEYPDGKQHQQTGTLTVLR